MSLYIMSVPNKDFVVSRHMNVMHTLQSWSDLYRNIHCSHNKVDVVKETTMLGKSGIYFRINNEIHKVVSVPVSYDNIVFDSKRKILWYGFCNNEQLQFKTELDTIFEETGITVLAVAIELINKFSSLSQCVNILSDGTLIWYASALSDHSQDRISSFYPVQIRLAGEDGFNYVAAGLQADDKYVCSCASDEFKKQMDDLGYHVETVDMKEWHKHGLTIKCLVNEIIE